MRPGQRNQAVISTSCVFPGINNGGGEDMEVGIEEGSSSWEKLGPGTILGSMSIASENPPEALRKQNLPR